MFFGENLNTIEDYIVQNHQELVVLLYGGISKHLYVNSQISTQAL